MIGLIASLFGNLTVLLSGLAKESDKTKQEIIKYYEGNLLPPSKGLDRLNPHNSNSYYDIRTDSTKRN